MRKSVHAGFAATTLLITSMAAQAADMPVKIQRSDAYNWTGCYIGDNVGWIGLADKLDNRPGPAFVAAQALSPAQIAVDSHSYNPRGSGFTGGAQVGCNWQGSGSSLLFGVELDFNMSKLRESTTATYPFILLNIHSETLTTDIKWFSTFRLRQGFVWDRLLMYVTGGLAIAHINSSQALQFLNGINPPSYDGFDSRTRIGFTVGGGHEYAFTNNLSVKVEYLYLYFGTYTFASPFSVDPAIAGGNFAWATDVRPREHIVRAGLNYKFY